MEQQRSENYYRLIHHLLTCRDGEESKILMAKPDLIDDGLVQAMKQIAAMMAQQGNQNFADYLIHIAEHLPNSPFFRSVTPATGAASNASPRANFVGIPPLLERIFQTFIESNGNPPAVYSLLQANRDELDDNFVEQFRNWAFSTLPNAEPEAAQRVATLISEFSNLIWQFPLGNRAINLEIAITGYEVSATIFTRKAFPEQWALNRMNLAPAYRHRIKGDHADNLEKGIAACLGALEVITRKSPPEQWARIQNNLGLLYTDRITGDRTDNIEKSIACYEEALQVVTRSSHPELWGTLQNNLGNAYLFRTQGNETKNLEKAIACYQVALQVRTHSASPYYWASSQFNLGSAYSKRVLGNREQNLQRAISAYKNALQVYTASDYPERWAGAEASLGNAYRETDQITEALNCFRAALRVFTPTSFPRDCIKTGLSLGDTALAAEMKAEAFEGYAVAIEAVEQNRRWANAFAQGREIPEELLAYTKMVVFCITNGERNKAREYAQRSGSQSILNLLDSNEFQQIQAISQFLGQVLQTTSESNGDPQVVYQFLEANLDKLDDRCVEMLGITKAVLLQVTSEEAINMAAAILNFSSLIQHFSQGNGDINWKIANIGYEVAATVFTQEAFPEQWTFIQQRLRSLFLFQLCQATSEIKGNPQVIYPLLKANKDKLDERFATVLRDEITAALSEAPPEYAQGIAEGFVGLSLLIKEFRKGNEANHLEIAITGYEVASTVLTGEAFPEQWGLCQTLLGNAYHGRLKGDRAENMERAIAYLRNALQVRTRDEFPELWAEIQSNLGIAYGYRIRGDQSENAELAIAAGMAAMQVYTRDDFPEQWAQIQNNLGIVYRDRIESDKAENLEQAIACYQNALEIRTREDFPELWAQTQMNLASAYRYRLNGDRTENIELAIAANQAALQVYTQEAFPKDWAGVQMNLANAYGDRIRGDRGENLETAMATHQAALKVFTQQEFPREWAMTQMNLGNAYFKLEQIDEAIACYRSALKVFTSTTFPWECLHAGRQFGHLAFADGRWLEAIQGYGAAIEAVETSRNWATSESRRQEILAEAIDVYENMVQACINAERLEKAIEYVERSRSKRLVDLMASTNLDKGGEIPPEVKELLQQYESLQERIDQERSQNDSGNNRELMGVGSSTQSRAAFQAKTQAIANLEAEKQQIWEQLRRLDPVLAGEIQVSAPDFAAMQKLIDQPTTAILSFYTTSNDTYIFVLRQNQITLHTCTGQGIETLQSWIFQNWLKPYIEDANTWKSQISDFLSELAQRLHISDLISQHLEDITELILVPHLTLHQIPLAAVPIENGQYLGDKFLIRYTPNCQVLEFCQERGEMAERLTYGIVEDATEDLPFASFEGDRIAQLYNIPERDRLRGRSQCTKIRYRQLAKQVQVLHSCHHAQSRLDEPLESVLQLADETITLGELLTPGWRLLNLFDVFLSCCETGLGVTLVTDDILTLSTGFLCAGARSVVSTLWSVNDLATALFSLFYYQHRQQRKSRPEALQQAQIELRELKKEELLNREDIKALSKQAEARQKEAIRERKQYQQGSAERLKWEHEYRKYVQVTNQIDAVKSSKDECPFSHPRFWAAFTCQGLR
ncbi:MAG: CHAT domain-containing protein [Cyanobacteriota bacterium]